MVGGGGVVKKERSSRIKSKPNYLEAYDEGKPTKPSTTSPNPTDPPASSEAPAASSEHSVAAAPNPSKPAAKATSPEPPNTSPSEPVLEEKVEPVPVKEEVEPPSLQSPKMEEETMKEEVEETKKENVNKKAEDAWKAGEKILCFHGPLIYEAKIQNIEVLNGVYRYFIHYRGWNKNWDEWVPQARMLKFTEKNSSIQKDLTRAHQEKNNEKRNRGLKRKGEEAETEVKPEHVFAVPKAPSPAPRARRKAGLRPQRREVKNDQSEEPEEKEGGKEKETIEKPPDGSVESEDIYKSKVEIKVKIPDELKSFIVDDWEQITRHKNVCVLPAKITVDKLLDDYTRVKTNNSESANKNNKQKAIAEVTAGMREYFNVMLPAQLLYKQERQQFDQLKRNDPNLLPIKVYGAAHLLRLFTKLGETLVYTPLPSYSVNLLLLYLNDILNYIKRNSSIIFSNSDYQSTKEDQESNSLTPEG